MKTYLISIALLAVVSISCKQTPTEPVLGTLSGRVVPFSVSGDSLPNLLAGISVWIPGTNFSSQTDAAGHWSIDHIPASLYKVMFSRPGFDTSYFDQVLSHGAGVDFVDTTSILQIPTDNVVLDYVEVRDSVVGSNRFKYIAYGGHASSQTFQESAMLCSLDSSRANAINYPAVVQNGKFSGTFMSVGYNPSADLVSGQQIYVQPSLWPYQGKQNHFLTYTYGFGPRDVGNAMTVTVP